VGHPMATKPFLLWALVVNNAILAQHTNELFCPTNPKFVTMVVGQMWTWQDGMDGSMSCSQMEVGHHLHPKFLFNNPNFQGNVLANPCNIIIRNHIAKPLGIPPIFQWYVTKPL